MGWKGTVRSIAAASRRAERDAQRRRRELEAQRKRLDRMQELERAAYEVDVYENSIDLLLSVHKECSNPWNWEAIKSADPPAVPERTCSHEESAQAALDAFRPSLVDKILNRSDSKRDELAKTVAGAKRTDEAAYQESLEVYKRECTDWEAACQLASQVLTGNQEAYLDAIRQTGLFGDIPGMGSSIKFHVRDRFLVEAALHVQGEGVIPSEVKSLLKSGKLSVKQMPKSKFYALYQDHVCGCVLRIARELLALLPVKMVIVNAVSELLNTQTGYMEVRPVLSVAIPRETLRNLNLELIDPSDSMGNFVHRMAFSKTKGFQAVEAIEPSDIQL